MAGRALLFRATEAERARATTDDVGSTSGPEELVVDWANERWVRLYTRDSTTWKMLDWRARTVLMHLLRRVDRAGVLDVGDTGTLGLAAVLELPLEIVEAGIERLLHPRLRVVVETPTAYVVPKFLDAQEAVQTTNHRSAEYRARKRDFALAAAKPAIAELVRLPVPAAPVPQALLPLAVTKRDATATAGDAARPLPGPVVTKRDASVARRDASVTAHHAASRAENDELAGERRLSAATPIIGPSGPATVTRPDAGVTSRDGTVTAHHGASLRSDLIRSGSEAAHSPASAIPAPAAVHGVPEGESAWHRRRAWWQAMLEADARLRTAGVAPNAAPLPPAPAGENEQRMARCERQLAEAGYRAADVDAKMRHIVLVAEAEALRERHRRWFKPALIWDPARAARAADTSLEEAAMPRAGPRAGPRSVSASDARYGRVEPSPPAAYPDGEIKL